MDLLADAFEAHEQLGAALGKDLPVHQGLLARDLQNFVDIAHNKVDAHFRHAIDFGEILNLRLISHLNLRDVVGMGQYYGSNHGASETLPVFNIITNPTHRTHPTQNTRTQITQINRQSMNQSIIGLPLFNLSYPVIYLFPDILNLLFEFSVLLAYFLIVLLQLVDVRVSRRAQVLLEVAVLRVGLLDCVGGLIGLLVKAHEDAG